MKYESISVNPVCKQSCARYWFCRLPSLLINSDFRPPGHLLGLLWLSSSIRISAAHTVSAEGVQGLGPVLEELSCSFAALLGVASPHSLALFSCADHDVCVSRRSAFEQDVERGNTDGLGDCQSKQAFLHSYLSSSTLHPLHLSSASTRSPLFSSVPFLLRCCHLFVPRLFRPHNPLFQAHPSICPSRHSSSTVLSPAASLAPWSIDRCVRSGKDWAFSLKLLKGRTTSSQLHAGKVLDLWAVWGLIWKLKTISPLKQPLNSWKLFFHPSVQGKTHETSDHFMPRWLHIWHSDLSDMANRYRDARIAQTALTLLFILAHPALIPTSFTQWRQNAVSLSCVVKGNRGISCRYQWSPVIKDCEHLERRLTFLRAFLHTRGFWSIRNSLWNSL